jgi:catechol 2,3-dioxygenase-like lactoylglutathione lyase family enzyme
MLADTTAVATVAAKDLAAARRFYGETLGLPEIGRPDAEVTVYRSGNSSLNVYHSEFAGTNKATAVTWSVGDAFDDLVAELKSKGVRFEHYDMPGAKMDGDVHVFDGDMRVVWFKDPDGNILNLINR